MSRKNEQAASGWGRLGSERDEKAQRRQALEAPGEYHGDIAAAELHWFDADGATWLTRDPMDETWHGFDAASGKPVRETGRPGDWRPWDDAFDDSGAPFYRWFAGGLTNACFNEVDRHVLGGRGTRPAFVFEGDRWDPSKNEGRGGPVFQLEIACRRLLLETVIRAQVLASLGLGKGDRVAFNLPNIPDQLYYTEAAKRLGIIYTPV
ncbi:MAG TPA: acetyl-coenzyme A synthetase N-terminal domain-containing protein, partial [Woeseiaceae bacterium]|nr:acetyl-coenzyme A synthetase N-terminal domain-containing protein [Woeseiaceae bacterium]